MSIRRPCQRCGTLIPTGRLCPDCRHTTITQPKQQKNRERQRELGQREPEAHKVWQSQKWRTTRAQIIQRDQRCIIGTDCTRSLEVHHIVKVRDGGAPYDPDNLITLCARHHRLIDQGLLAIPT